MMPVNFLNITVYRPRAGEIRMDNAGLRIHSEFERPPRSETDVGGLVICASGRESAANSTSGLSASALLTAALKVVSAL